MNHQIKKYVKDILFEYCTSCSENYYTNKLKFSEDLGLDSLDVLELVIILEKHFNIVFSSVEIENLKTIENLEELITEKLK